MEVYQHFWTVQNWQHFLLIRVSWQCVLTWVLAVWGTLVCLFLLSMKDLWVVSWARFVPSTPAPQDPVLLTLLVSSPDLMIESSELPRSAAEPLSQFWSFGPTCNEREFIKIDFQSQVFNLCHYVTQWLKVTQSLSFVILGIRVKKNMSV